jgi:exodeoxyribonuclease VII large subunit
MGARLDRALERRITRARGELDRAAGALRPAMLEQRLASARQRLDEATGRLTRGLENRLTRARGQLDRITGALRPAMLDQRLASARDRLDRTGRLLESLNPEAPLGRGYAWVSARPSGAVVGSAGAARGAGAVTLHFADGTVDARVERPASKSYAAKTPEQPSLL